MEAIPAHTLYCQEQIIYPMSDIKVEPIGQDELGIPVSHPQNNIDMDTVAKREPCGPLYAAMDDTLRNKAAIYQEFKQCIGGGQTKQEQKYVDWKSSVPPGPADSKGRSVSSPRNGIPAPMIQPRGLVESLKLEPTEMHGSDCVHSSNMRSEKNVQFAGNGLQSSEMCISEATLYHRVSWCKVKNSNGEGEMTSDVGDNNCTQPRKVKNVEDGIGATCNVSDNDKAIPCKAERFGDNYGIYNVADDSGMTNVTPCKVENSTNENVVTCDRDLNSVAGDGESMSLHFAQYAFSNKIRTDTKKGKNCCPCCGRGFTSRRELLSHVLTHPEYKPFKCSWCEYRAVRREDFDTHTRAHTDEELYTGSPCDYRSVRQGDLNRHRKTLSDQKRYTCPQCDSDSAQKDNLHNHMKTQTGEKPYKCPLCAYRSGRQGDLNKHRRIHTQDKPYGCSLCSFTSAEQRDLVKHTRTHRGEKPYKCSNCDYATTRKVRLTEHIMRMHSDKKPYTCSQCDYKARRQCQLVSHVKTHTNLVKCGTRVHTTERPYRCSECDQGKCHLHKYTGKKSY